MVSCMEYRVSLTRVARINWPRETRWEVPDSDNTTTRRTFRLLHLV